MRLTIPIIAEALESRQLMAATVTLTHTGTLLVQGTNTANRITLYAKADGSFGLVCASRDGGVAINQHISLNNPSPGDTLHSIEFVRNAPDPGVSRSIVSADGRFDGGLVYDVAAPVLVPG